MLYPGIMEGRLTGLFSTVLDWQRTGPVWQGRSLEPAIPAGRKQVMEGNEKGLRKKELKKTGLNKRNPAGRGKYAITGGIS